jgi:flagellar hook-associated protein 1
MRLDCIATYLRSRSQLAPPRRLSATPQDPTVRATVINAATNFAQQAQTISSSLQSTASNELTQLPAMVDQVNQTTQQIAALNGQIVSATADGQSGAALMDQRDALVNTLAVLIGASADANGNVTVGGVPLVEGGVAMQLGVTGSGTSTGLEVQLANGSIPIQSDQVQSQIGGVLAGASAITNLLNQMDTFATSVAIALNQQHKAASASMVRLALRSFRSATERFRLESTLL